MVAAATANTRLRFPPEGWDTSRPTYTALPLASNFAAFLASFAVVAALTERHRTGRGEQVSVPLFNATFEMIGGAGVSVAARGLQSKGKLDANGSGTYRCADGRWVQFDPIGGSTRFIGWFLDAVGEPALAARARLMPDDPELRKELRAIMAGNAGEVVEIPTSHSPFLSRPDLIAAIIAERWERVRAARS